MRISTHPWYTDRPAKDTPSILGDYPANGADVKTDHTFAPGELVTEPEVRLATFATQSKAQKALAILIEAGYNAILSGNGLVVAYTDGSDVYSPSTQEVQ